MTTVEQNIVNTYARLFEGLSKFARLELIERITLSLKEEDKEHKEDKKAKEDTDFFNLFGAFPDDKTAEEMVTEIKSSRQFREKDLTI
ncbi:hypothetical protein [Capnocytophaga granulosa]|uniref:hypothetical protein n=1 Tax=Capnocytophaga granulosa TaxID=45242 RepID=UPI0028EE22EB|nr:hypothetical protein [Capnocytophaga granulosa]